MKYAIPAAAFATALLSVTAVQAANTPAAMAKSPPAYADPVIADANAMQSADQIHHTNLRQQLMGQLAKAGYTDIKVMPSSFYIQAKDKKGEPVAMVIGPDSFTEVTELPGKTAAMTPQAPAKMQTPSAQPSPVQK